MPNFYFVDTNLLIGGCIPFDYLHDACVSFFEEKEKRRTFLLFSVEAEFFKKIQAEMISFSSMVGPALRDTIVDLSRLIKRKERLPHHEELNFLKYIFHLCKTNEIKELSHASLIEIKMAYFRTLKEDFDVLTHNWIKHPHMIGHPTLLNDKIYRTHYLRLKKEIHEVDTRHLALAALEVEKRNRKHKGHHYFFYTNDKEWIEKDLESKINIPNLKIKRIKYEDKLGYNPETGSFNLKKIHYVSDGL